jgi:transposase InsO family protein
LRGPIRGQFYYLYLVVDIWSRMIVAWQVAEQECEQISSRMIAEACMRHGVEPEQLVLHSDYAEEKLMPKLAQFSFSCKRIAVKISA